MSAPSDSIEALVRDTKTYARFLKDIGLEFMAPARPEAPAGRAIFPPPEPPARHTAQGKVSFRGGEVAEPKAPYGQKSGATVPRGAPSSAAAPRGASSSATLPGGALPGATLPGGALQLRPGPVAPAIPVKREPHTLIDLAAVEPLPVEGRVEALRQITAEVAVCVACPLSQSRTHTVPGEGAPTAELMFIGEGPGADEDRLGRPFVGRAGQKLDEMIAYLGLPRKDVFICNIVKCRPPGNRNPEPGEAAACRHFLDRQIEAVRPRVICLLGSVALKYLTGNMAASITRLRGQWTAYRGIPAMPTFHPAYLLRQFTDSNRRLVANDVDAIRAKMQELGCKVGAKQGKQKGG